jgi:hypothetical protein
MKRAMLVIIAPLVLAGCFQVREARLEYQTSAEQYKACVAAKGPAGCESERVIMETDERKYTSISGAADGNNEARSVTVQRR